MIIFELLGSIIWMIIVFAITRHLIRKIDGNNCNECKYKNRQRRHR